MIARLMLMMVLSVLLSCERTDKKPLETYQVKLSTVHKTVHFTGTIQPLAESTLASPVDGYIETAHYRYGQWVQKGQVIFTLNSAQRQQQYNDTLTDYLKAKDNYSIARSKFMGTEELWQAGLISKNNYLSEKSSLHTARVSLMQAARKLSEFCEKSEIDQWNELSTLSFSEFDKVRLALTRPHQQVQIRAETDGVLLYPPKIGETDARFSAGTSVKPGQAMGLVGDLTGLRIEINVPEVNITDLKIGMAVTVRGNAFNQQSLQGKIVGINAQALSVSNNTLPTFIALVEVRPLTPEQQSWVKIGMSAEVEVAIESSQKMMIPIAAVQQRQGQRVVQIRSKNGQIHQQAIVTGMVEGDRVQVESGLSVDDVVVYG